MVDTKEAFDNIVSNGTKAFAGFYTLKNTFGKYVSAAASFEEGINSIKNPLALSEEQKKAYENAIKNLARTTPTATSELIAMSGALIQNGVSASSLNEMTTLTNKVAIGFGLDSTKAAELTGKLHQMWLKADEINLLAGQIHNLGESLQTNPQAILNVVDKLGESGKQIGFSLEQTAALSGALNSLGVGANESEKAIEKLYESFAKGDNNAFLQMGIDPQDFANALKQNTDVTLQAFMKMISKYDSHTQKQLLTSLVGAKESTALLKLAHNMDIYTKAKKKMNDANAKSKLDGEVAAVQQGFNNQLKVFNNSVTDLWQNIGNALLPTVSTLLDYLTSGIQLVSDFTANHQTLTQVIVGGVSALVAYKSALFALESGKNIFKLIGLPITALNERIKLSAFLARGTGTAMQTSSKLSISSIWAVSRALTLACASNPIGLIITAIVGIGFAVWKNWDIIKSFFSGVYDGFMSAFAPITESLTPTFNTIGNVISWVWDKIKAFFSFFTTQTEYSSEQLENARSTGERFGQGLAKAFEIVMMPVRGLIYLMQELISWITKAYDYTVGLIDKASEIKSKIGDSIGDAWDNTKKAFSTGFGLWGDDEPKVEQKAIKNTQVNELIKLNVEYDKAKQEQVINNQNKQKSITDNKQINIYVDNQQSAQEIATIVQAQDYSFADM
ncbi:phage tail tape measure protein [Campylobacter sp. RM5004]|uniref:phage tail tape measure protein n=1 Tax=Campylobacter sp. RM5004 TaxID=1660078 RepID=UPI001EFBD742|nr:phage tail tape measure protein [Campylobacter sp. RM5004]ULO01377.1 phage tail tape measure protein [Campylobacter sp. RM5004]